MWRSGVTIVYVEPIKILFKPFSVEIYLWTDEDFFFIQQITNDCKSVLGAEDTKIKYYILSWNNSAFDGGDVDVGSIFLTLPKSWQLDFEALYLFLQ